MVSVSFGALAVLVTVFLTLALPVVLVWGLYKFALAIVWLIGGLLQLLVGGVRRIARLVVGGVRRVAGLAGGSVRDGLHFVGGVITGAAVAPLAVANVCIGRWSAAAHYGRALEDEFMSSAICLYRLAIGRPVRFLGLGVLTDGIERRLPELVARAPRSDKPRGGRGTFEGYKVLGTLPAGGSGAKLYLARPDATTLERFIAAGSPDPGKVVIKSFALAEGSTLPQIVRESRALEAARRLGLVLDHDLGTQRFHYVMPYVPGDDLDTVITRVHSRAPSEGLDERRIGQVLGYSADLLATLDRFHAEGLWHKDIKPSNLIVSDERVHLVDLGLVTPLESAMTLTTHGTEYFRDPELVRLALKGVKVHEVDGVKFDVYSAGAVLYAMIENSFPAHGSLSRITKRCPESLQWIIRRAMADMNTRYGSAREMLADLEALRRSKDAFAMRPAQLPSVSGDTDGLSSLAFRGTPSAPDAASARQASFQADDGSAPTPLPRPTTSGKTRRSRRRRMLAAALVLLATGVMATGLAALGERNHHRGRAVAQASRTVRVPAVDAERTRLEQRVQGVAKAWSRELSPKVPERDGARALVVADLSPATDPVYLDGLRRFLDARGYIVFGLGDRPEPEDLVWTAGARQVLGLADPTDVQAQVRLEEYLAECESLSAVVWITSAPSEQGGFLYHTAVQADLARVEPARIVFEGALR